MNEPRLQRNLSLLTDFYELTMANGYFESGMAETVGVFDMFFRQIPDDAGFVIFAGLEQLIECIDNFSFTPEDIAFLRGKGCFSEGFLNYLAHFKFTCDVWSMEEGTPAFPGEPLVTVRGPLIQAQLLETLLLLTINFPTLIATKASRVVRAARGRSIMEFGSRRAQSYDAAVLGARAAYIAGCDATACVLCDQLHGVPAVGTMAHSWVQSFPDEYQAFAAYARLYPNNCTLLIDTYNVMKSGLPNAIRTFNEVLGPMGIRPKGVRIDSGDIAYLSKRIRRALDAAGYADVKIVASNALDEYLIRTLLEQGAQVDSFGVGENLITSKSAPVFGGVYKLVAVMENGVLTPKIKISETQDKITTPHLKSLYRLYSNENGMAVADYITLFGEEVRLSPGLTIFDSAETWKKKYLTDFTARPLLAPIYENGRRVYKQPTLAQSRTYCQAQLDTLWDEVKRFEFPHRYYVDLSYRLWESKQDLLKLYTEL